MIKPGIKIGPENWLDRLRTTASKYCEVWFRVDRLGDYNTMFAYLAKQCIHTGLHFWASTQHHWFPNIAYPDKRILEPTINLIELTIDIAAQHHFHYVNIHSGNRRVFTINFDQESLSPHAAFPKISLATAVATQNQSLHQLHRYATTRGVLLLTETITARLAPSWRDLDSRLTPIDHLPVPVDSLIDLSHQGFYITNDFAHTFCDEYDQPLPTLFQSLVKKTIALAPQTKLLHINTLIPPYNGTDTHHGITDKDFAQSGIVPSRSQFKQLLTLFKNRFDVWAINEPTDDHLGNFFALKQLLSEL